MHAQCGSVRSDTDNRLIRGKASSEEVHSILLKPLCVWNVLKVRPFGKFRKSIIKKKNYNLTFTNKLC